MDKEISKQYKRLILKSILVLCIGILLVIISPYIFTRNVGIIDFSKTGQIGDTIGGITAPIVGLIGGFLVLISFAEQWKANRIQWKELEKIREDKLKDERIELVWKLYDEVKNDFNKIEHIDVFIQNLTQKTAMADSSYNALSIHLNPILNNFNYLLLLFLGLNQGRIRPDYAATFIFKFETLYDSFEILYKGFPDIAARKVIENHFNKITPNLEKLRKLNWIK